MLPNLWYDEHTFYQMVNKMNFQRDEHWVHLIIYHLIWCPKQRKKQLHLLKLLSLWTSSYLALVQQSLLNLRPFVGAYGQQNTRLLLNKYLASTAGNVSSETVQQYITAHSSQ